MADAKISELNVLTVPADDDVFAIVDTSANETKKISYSDLVAAIAAGNLIRSETPSGVIDGANKAYTVLHTVHTVLMFGLGVAAISPENYSFTGNAITFSTALDASLSGQDFWIVYV